MNNLYQAQRAMRAMRKAAMQRGVVAILDIGTSKIACLVLRFDGTVGEDAFYRIVGLKTGEFQIVHGVLPEATSARAMGRASSATVVSSSPSVRSRSNSA